MADLEKRLSEQVLVLRCQTGDETAFAQLVERYGPRLRYYLQKTFGRRDGVEDALQEVWFTVFRKVRDLADPGAFTTWLYRIAQRQADGVLRKRRPSFCSVEEADQVIDPSAEESDFSPEAEENGGKVRSAWPINRSRCAAEAASERSARAGTFVGLYSTLLIPH
jgi:RNA polymerase sigma-70 factor (ECF subfamily)